MLGDEEGDDVIVVEPENDANYTAEITPKKVSKRTTSVSWHRLRIRSLMNVTQFIGYKLFCC